MTASADYDFGHFYAHNMHPNPYLRFLWYISRSDSHLVFGYSLTGVFFSGFCPLIGFLVYCVSLTTNASRSNGMHANSEYNVLYMDFVLFLYRYSVIRCFVFTFFGFLLVIYGVLYLLIFMYGVQGRYLRIDPVNVYTGMACCLSNRGNIHDIRSPVS